MTSTLALTRVPAEEREMAERLAAAFGRIQGAVTKAFPVLAGEFGYSVSSIRAKYYAWKEGGVVALVNAARNPEFAEATSLVDPETYEYFRQLCIENGRKLRPAFRKLCTEFFTDRPIPGVAPGTPRNRLPSGWTYNNFVRRAPSPFEIKAARQGLRAANSYRPLVYTSRREMHFFAELQFDDMWHDVECAILGGREQRVRPLQLGAMDVYSACLFEWVLKPRIRREDGTRTNLGPHDMLFLLAMVFAKYGHNSKGTRLNLEAGTATLSDEAIDLIHKLSGGQVVCRVGETSAPPAFLGQYPGQAKGNFRTRALIESFWNLTHNETADRMLFPAQTGSSSRENAPEDLVGRGKEMDRMLQAVPALPDWAIATLRMPMPEWRQAVRALNEINEAMNRRGQMPGTEHNIEGFDCHVAVDFDLPGVGIVSRAELERRMMELSQGQRDAVLSVCNPKPRKLSPREVFTAGLGNAQMVRWRRDALARLLYPARRPEPVKVGKDGLITFQDKDISPDVLRFKAHHFSPGDEFEAVCSPLAPGLLFVYEATGGRKGAWVGCLEHWGTVSRMDTVAVKEQIAEAERMKHQLLRPLEQLGERMAARRLEDAQAVVEVLGQVRTDAEQTVGEHRRRLRKFDGMEELAESTSETTAPEPAEGGSFGAEGLL